MATVERRVSRDGKVRWTMRVFVGRDPDTGKRKFIIRTFDRKGNADAEARRLERMKDQGGLVAPSRDPLKKYLEHWLDHVKSGQVRARTLDDYRRMLKRYVTEPSERLTHGDLPIGAVRMDRLRPEHFQELYSRLWRELELSPRTIRYLHAVLRQALEHAVATRALPRNPTDHVKPPSQPYEAAQGEPSAGGSLTTVRAMSEAEAVDFVSAAQGDRYAALWVLLLTGGLRPGEAFALQWEDVDLSTGKIQVRRSLTRKAAPKMCACGHPRGVHDNKGAGCCTAEDCRDCDRYDGVRGWTLTAPKTDRARRTVVLPPMTVHALKAWRKKTAGERLKLGSEYADHGFVFCNEFGRPLEASNLFERNFRRVMGAARLGNWEVRQGKDWMPLDPGTPVVDGRKDKKKKRFRPSFRIYDLRHTCATLLLKKGVNPKIVSERLGHASITLTLDTYSHVLPDMQEGATEALQQMLGRNDRREDAPDRGSARLALASALGRPVQWQRGERLDASWLTSDGRDPREDVLYEILPKYRGGPFPQTEPVPPSPPPEVNRALERIRKRKT